MLLFNFLLLSKNPGKLYHESPQKHWSNDAKNLLLSHYNLKYIQIENSYFELYNISQYYCFFFFFYCFIVDQIIPVLMGIDTWKLAYFPPSIITFCSNFLI